MIKHKIKDERGRIRVLFHKHPRANVSGYVFEHILIAEKVLGKPLKKGVVIHHVNENVSDNSNDNLVVCENDTYHKLLHCRLRAMRACGKAHWRKCNYCGQYDSPENMNIYLHSGACHKGCAKKKNTKQCPQNYSQSRRAGVYGGD